MCLYKIIRAMNIVYNCAIFALHLPKLHCHPGYYVYSCISLFILVLRIVQFVLWMRNRGENVTFSVTVCHAREEPIAIYTVWKCGRSFHKSTIFFCGIQCGNYHENAKFQWTHTCNKQTNLNAHLCFNIQLNWQWPFQNDVSGNWSKVKSPEISMTLLG